MFPCKTTCDLPSANEIHPSLHIHTQSSNKKRVYSWRYKGNKVSDYCSWKHLLMLSSQRVGGQEFATWVALEGMELRNFQSEQIRSA